VGSIQRTRIEVASIIEAFLNGTDCKWEWDDFCSVTIADPELDSVRRQCRELWLTYPPQEKGNYCSQAGFQVLRELTAKLRASS
jgi:hypothetical protein